MSETDHTSAAFVNYPAAKAHDIPYQAPPPNKNPVIKGLTLQFLPSVIAAFPFLYGLLWNNAGFGALRSREELDDVEPRYDPTVIPVLKHGEEDIESYTNVSRPRLPHNASFSSIAHFHDAYMSGKLTPTDVVEYLLPLIRRDTSERTAHSIAFVDTKEDLVWQAAEASAKRWREGKPLGILDGVPFAVKDEMDIKGYKRYVGTRHDHTKGKSVETSWCIKKLEEEGAIMMGKLNMHELGLDTTNNNPFWGTPLNPYNNTYYCGGSSGGSAYAVAQGILPFAVGADGGGSIRIPSNYCGIYGLKPSHGRISTLPLMAPLNTTTVQGPLAGNMIDLEISYRVLAQRDVSHPTQRQFAVPRPLSAPRKKIIGIPTDWFNRADPPVKQACEAAVSYFKKELGYDVVEIAIPLLREGQMAHALTILSESMVAEPDVTGLSGPNKVVLNIAQATPARDFLLAQRLRNLLMQHLADLFQKYPGLVIVTPTTPNAGWRIGAGELAYGVSDGNTQVRNMEYVWLANFTGLPCIQFPVGYVDAVQGKGKIPVGLSGNGEWGSEDALIEFGYDGERYLNEVYEGGRQRPEGWVDVICGKRRVD